MAIRSAHTRRLDRHRQRNRRNRIREEVRAYKVEKGCRECGDRRPDVLQFHHRDPATKITTIQDAMASGMREAKVWEEIAKCDVLCANCHCIEHAEERRRAGKLARID